jgi:AcrR family transcriptional regulator
MARSAGSSGRPRSGAASTATRHRARSGAPAQTRELRARGRETMRKLLDAGVEVFAARGYHAARVDDIVKLAETSHGTFYLYFSNKEDLFRALTEEVAAEMQTLAESLGPIAPGAAGFDSLRAWIDDFTALYERYGPVIRAWTEAEIGSTEFGRLGNDVLAKFTRVLTMRISAVAPPDLDPLIASVALVAMLERLNYYALSQQVAIDRARMVDTLARVTHGALFGADAR